ncbi:MAG: acyloxyacyl hydrolase [Balneolaceae bacterium]
MTFFFSSKNVCTYFVSTILTCLLVSICARNAHAQINSEIYNEYKFQMGYAHSGNSVVLLGKTPNTTSNLFYISGSKLLKSYNATTFLYYTSSIQPYLKYHYPRRDYDGSMAEVQGFGIAPFGLQLQKVLNNRVSALAESTGGFALVQHNFPTDKGRKLNFTFDISTTLVVELMKPISLAAGYKFHHISNANTGRQNPGIDSNFLFISLYIN